MLPLPPKSLTNQLTKLSNVKIIDKAGAYGLTDR